MAITARDIEDALRARFSDSRRYAVATEVQLSTGNAKRRMDMVVADCYESNGFRVDGFEFKVSKADLRRELEDPSKHTAFFGEIDYYTLACPEGIADLVVIPPKWGVLTVKEDGSTRYRRKPLPLRDSVADGVSRGFFASFVRAIQGREPAAAALRREYDRGVADARESAESLRGYRERLVDEKAGEIAKYEELQLRLHLWDKGDPEAALARFEAFQNLHIPAQIGYIRSEADRLSMLADGLEAWNGVDDEDT